MKSVWCTIWILGALLVFATLDARPDPPGVSPNAALCELLHVHQCSSESAAPRCDSLTISDPISVDLITASVREPARPIDPMVSHGQAADSSPPLPPARPFLPS